MRLAFLTAAKNSATAYPPEVFAESLAGARSLKGFVLRLASNDGFKTSMRVLLFVYVVLIVCPIQYWSLDRYSDSTWYFAVNYAAQHHLTMGRDFVFTSGPLSYLAVPQDIGNNLAKGLAWQAVLWVFAAAVVWKLFFRSGFALRNVAFFAIFLGFSGQLYQYPDSLGAGDLLFTCALVLLLQFQLEGGMRPYLAGLVAMGLIPLIKFVGMFSVAGAIFGFVFYRILSRRGHALRDTLLAIGVTALVAFGGLRLAVGSFQNLGSYLHASLELSRGYNQAMSVVGSPVELVAAFEALLLVAGALGLVAAGNRQTALFLGCLSVVPLFLSFKHGFVRQDVHIMHFFGSVAIVLALAALSASLTRPRAIAGWCVILLVFATIWQDNVARTEFRTALAAVTGIRTPLMVWPALRLQRLRQTLDARAQRAFPPESRIEPEIAAIVGQKPVASLSISYNNTYLSGLNLQLYPVIQRYSAYTPYLDELNAQWVRDRGPQFLLFDGASIDGRHPWLETPAMWLEVYRWYDLKLVGTHNLLLERRSAPRFQRMQELSQSQIAMQQPLRMPDSPTLGFWSLQCSLSPIGRMRELLFRVPEITVTVEKKDGDRESFRAVPAVLGAPAPGNYLPGNLEEFARFFAGTEKPGDAVASLTFGGPGISAYNPECSLGWRVPSSQ